MKLKSFRIINYKSILDSESCYVNSALTILAGKNESGKTNVLTALQHLSNGAFSERDYPLRKDQYKPKVFYEFVLSNKDYEVLNEELKGLLIENEIHSDCFSFVLDERGEIILSNENLLTILQDKIKNNLQTKITYFNEQLKSINFEQELTELEDISKCVNMLKMSEIENKEEIINKLLEIEQSSNTLSNELINNSIKKIMPKIVYFNSFKDNLPDVIRKEHLDPNNEHYTIVNRLFKYLNIDKDKIFFQIKTEDDDRKRADYIASLEKIISDDLFTKYKQKPIMLKFRMSSLGGLHIDVYDADKKGFIHQGDLSYQISDRSEGFRWFLSFYVTLKGENFSDNDIVLIDEPGLYLHATAQKDMLNVFIEESKRNQIIFTTHSPYLIDINNLSRIRLVEKFKSKLDKINFEETKIISSIIKGADNETLTPIADAIGFNLNEGLSININGMIVVEGPSDYYYITKMATILGMQLNSSIIPAGGAPKIGIICSVLFGFKVAKITCLYDNDEAGNIAKNQNEENLGFGNIRHILISENKNFEIEDMFSISDFSKHIYENPSNLKNSKLVEKKNKTLLSKIFSDKCLSRDDFDQETICNFEALIQNLNNNIDE